MSLQTIDTGLLLLINNGLANGLFDLLMPFLSSQGYLLILPFLGYQLAAGSLRRDSRGRRYTSIALWMIVIAVLAVFAADRTEFVLKNAVGRVRPCRAVEGIRLIVRCPQSYSMPSGHALSSFAFAAPLFFLSRDYLPLAARLFPFVLAGLIVFSRIYLGVHYPSDVLVGSLLGVLIGYILSQLYRGIAKERETRRRKKRGAGS